MVTPTFFYIVAEILHGDILAPNVITIWLDYVLRTSTDIMKENGLTLKKKQEADDFPQKLSLMQTIQMI